MFRPSELLTITGVVLAVAANWHPVIRSELRLGSPALSPWPLVAFAPRKSAFVLYIGWKKHVDLLKTIGKHKTAGGCLHIKSLADVDASALQELVSAAAKSRQAASAK